MNCFLVRVFWKIEALSTLTNVLTLICTVPTGFLAYDILADFLYRRTTSASLRQIDFHQKYFPDIYICRSPGINENLSHRYGYHPANFWQGRIGDWDDGRFVGWNGRDGTENFTELRDKLLTTEAVKPLINELWYLSNRTWEMDVPPIKLRILRFPHWRCQVLEPRKNKSIDENTSFLSLTVNNQTQTNQSDDPRLDVLLRDPVNSPLLFPQSREMQGDHIRVPFDIGYRIFTIKVHRFHHLKENPHFECTEYTENNTYGSCIKSELKSIFEEALNCTPPLFVEDYSDGGHLCEKMFNVTMEEGNKIRDLFENQFNFKPSFCKKPCTQTTYDVQSVPAINFGHLSIGLAFDSNVDLTESEFKTSFVTLLTGLGGSVSRK